MDRLEAMALLITVVDTGSFSATARLRSLPATTVTRKITQLEAALGSQLLTRSTRKISLTDAGVQYVAAARRIIEQVQEAEREAAGEFMEPKGELVITAPVLFGQLHVLPVVAAFLAQFPEINARLVLADRNVDLQGDHVDMAVRIGQLPDSTLVATSVGTMRTVVCASPQFLAQQHIPQTPEDLRQLPCITFEGLRPAPMWQFRGANSSAPMEVAVQSRLSVTTAGAAVAAALQHVGITRLLHYQATQSLQTGALQLLLEDYEPAPLPVHLVHAGRAQMPLKMRRFIDFAAPRLRSVLRSLHEDTGTDEQQA